MPPNHSSTDRLKTNPSFYEKAGYFALPTYDLHLQPPSASTHNAYRKVNLNRDLPSLAEMYEKQNHNRTGPVVRDKKYWKCQMGFPRLDSDLFWIAEEREAIICYARGFAANKNLKILEFGYRPGAEGRLNNLITTMAQTVGKKTVHISYISKREVDIFNHWPHKLTENRVLMIRLLQLNRLTSFRKLFKPYHNLFWEADRY